MKRSQKGTSSFLSVLLSMVLALLLVGCGGGGGGGAAAPTPTPTPTTTTISGKVTLSSTVAGKPGMKKAMFGAPKGKPGSKAYAASKQASTALRSALLGPVLNTAAFASGTVYLYNSDHPEWLSPVASSPTDSAGAYSMSQLANSAANGNAYTDGAAIPAGNYTLLAFKSGGFDPILGTTTTSLVAIQAVVNSFSGNVTLSDLVAQESTSLPTVSAMIGAKQNTDGTQTWGSSATQLPANAAIQVSFSAAMSRGSLTNGISISPAVSGKWSLSADWTTATFYPDAGVTLAAGNVYAITVKGSDTDTTNAVKNVYGNALAKTATGTFTATAVDTVAPTALFVSPTIAEMGSPVDVTKPIRIGSNKQLDVNGLTLDGKVSGVSSLGAKPGVLYVGKDAPSGLYVYEFVLGVPLKLSTTYDLSVSGGKGLNGIAMNPLTGSLITTATTVGVDPTATVATQDAQAAVKDVFGKWMRSFSDRNITQLKSLMSGDFYFEDSKMDPASDLNHDGRLSVAEFTNMLSTQGFPQWEYCGTTITGDVVGTINVVGNNADFEFKMIATTTNTSKSCVNSVPNDSFYATVQNVNGAWTVVRASVGIDTRTKTISFPNLITTLSLSQAGATIADGGLIQQLLPNSVGVDMNPVTFSWGATTGVSSYVLLRIDGRDPQNGKACALPTTVTSFVSGSGCVTSGGVDVSGKFGFNTNSGSPTGMAQPFMVDGGSYYWDVIGLSTTTVSTIANKTSLEILKDISAISALQSFSVAGVYKEITALVYGGASASGTPVTYSVVFDGYDVGAANQATITVTTANTTATAGSLNVSGNFQKTYPLAFTSGVVTVTVDLSTGQNWINIGDGVSLNKSFSISTTGGIPPVVAITSIKDDTTTLCVRDAWNYCKAAAGAKKVTIAGTVSNALITTVDVNVWNDASSAYSYVSVPVSAGAFSATLDIYKGDNWINAGSGYTDPVTSSWVWYGDFAGVYTDTGTVWVPNISITSVTTATSTSNYGGSSDWDASLDADGVITIAGKFKNIANGTYSISGDGGYNNGTLTVLADGSFSLDVTLYNGWNYVSLSDANYNWYGVNIYTTTGKTVVKPTITQVNGVAPTASQFGGASATATGCTATVSGTAKAGNLNVNWNGFDGTNYSYESQTLVLTGADPVSFSFSVPLVGGIGSYNNIDVYDVSYMWTGVKVTTSGVCTYTAPVMTLGPVLNSSSVVLTTDMTGAYVAGTSASVTLTGTSSRAGRTITASIYACTSKNYSATASSTANASGTYDWSITGMPVYDGWNNVYLSDGLNSQNISVSTTNLAQDVGALTASVNSGTLTYTGSCGLKNWDTGAATTVTISGTTTAPDGTGNYTDSAGGSYPFTIVGGAYIITGVPVYQGTNYIYLYDSAWNYQTVTINSTNGAAKPKFVNIASPTQTLPTLVTGVQLVTGTITPGGGYAPTIVRATVYSNVTFTNTMYSSDTYEQTTYGHLPLTYSATTGSFSFSVDFGMGDDVYVDVYANDDVTWVTHRMSQEYNNLNGSNYSYYYKPGAKANGTIKNQAVKSEMMKQSLKSINRNR